MGSSGFFCPRCHLCSGTGGHGVGDIGSLKTLHSRYLHEHSIPLQINPQARQVSRRIPRIPVGERGWECAPHPRCRFSLSQVPLPVSQVLRGLRRTRFGNRGGGFAASFTWMEWAGAGRCLRAPFALCRFIRTKAGTGRTLEPVTGGVAVTRCKVTTRAVLRARCRVSSGAFRAPRPAGGSGSPHPHWTTRGN